MFSLVYKPVEKNEYDTSNKGDSHESSDIFGCDFVALSEYKTDQYG